MALNILNRSQGVLHLPKDMPLPFEIVATPLKEHDSGRVSIRLHCRHMHWLENVLIEMHDGKKITIKRMAIADAELQIEMFPVFDPKSESYVLFDMADSTAPDAVVEKKP